MGESWAISTLFVWLRYCAVPKKISRAELWKELLRNDIKSCFVRLSALDKFKLDLLLDQRAVCEVGVCTSST